MNRTGANRIVVDGVAAYAPMSQVLDRLYVGNLHAAADLAEHNPEGVHYVLNCTPHLVELPSLFRVRTLNLNDGEEVPFEALAAGLDFIYTFIGRGKVLVCCEAGISRSPGIASAYLTRCGMRWNDAVELVRQARPFIMIHPAISSSIKRRMGIVPIGVQA